MKRIVSLLLALALLTACLTAHAAEGYTTPVNPRPRDNTYSVDCVFAVGGGESITAEPPDTGYTLATSRSTARLTRSQMPPARLLRIARARISAPWSPSGTIPPAKAAWCCSLPTVQAASLSAAVPRRPRTERLAAAHNAAK